MELALLPSRGARRYHRQLAALEVEPCAPEDFAIAVDDHPFVEIRMQLADVAAQVLVRFAVHDPAGLLAARPPSLHPVTGGRLRNTRWRCRADSSPGARGVERARKARE